MQTQPASSTANEASRFGKFLVAGGVAASANYGSRFLFSLWFPFAVAITLAFIVGLLSGFVLMRRFVFAAHDRPAIPQALRYVGVNLFGLGQTLLISLLGEQFLSAYLDANQAKAVSHAVGVGFPIVLSYFGHRFATFR